MQIIKTDKGDITFKPKKFIVGSKIIDKAISKDNLLDFQRIMDKNNITFTLAYGTLLGAIRENDFITHDEDIDVAILDENRDNFLNILNDFIEDGFIIGRYADDILSLIRNGEYIDIYIFRKKLFGYREFANEKLKEKYLIDIVDYKFMNSTFKIPRESERYLIEHYGENWRVPVKDAHACNPNIYLSIKNFLKYNFKSIFNIISFVKKRFYAKTKSD